MSTRNICSWRATPTLGGDRVMAENYLQHAEHYYRIMAAAAGPAGPISRPSRPLRTPRPAGTGRRPAAARQQSPQQQPAARPSFSLTEGGEGEEEGEEAEATSYRPTLWDRPRPRWRTWPPPQSSRLGCAQRGNTCPATCAGSERPCAGLCGLPYLPATVPYEEAVFEWLAPNRGRRERQYGYREIHRTGARLHPVGARVWRCAEVNQQFTPEHLLKVLIDDEEGLAARPDPRRRRQCRTPCAAASKRRSRSCRKWKAAGAGQVYLAQDTARLLDNAEQVAKKAGDSFVTAEYLLLALALARAPTPAEILKDAGVTPRRSTRPSRICARAAPPTAPRPKTPMTRSRNMPAI